MTPTGERLQEELLLAIEAVARALARGAMQTDIGDAIEPRLPLLIEVGIVQERG